MSLPSWFIKLFTKEGDTVLDPFLGSGTTSISAALLNRNSIGVELLNDYYDIAIERFKEETSSNKPINGKRVAKIEKDFTESQTSLFYG